MNKYIINTFLKKFGAELHGSGYIRQLKSRQVKKNSLTSQFELLNGNAKIIFDVGANKGLLTKEYLQQFPAAFIHAFEPFNEYYPLWKEMQAANKNIVFNPLGVFDRNGQISFNVNVNHDTNSILHSARIGATSDTHCNTVNETTIDIITLDKYCSEHNIEHIDILKIDTQGSELAVLKGAQRMLQAKKIKLIYTETYFRKQYVDQPLFFEIAQYLSIFGYYVQDMYDPYYNDKFLLWCDTIFMPEKN